ncbi:regulatory protein SenC [Oceaniovalibus guishaninsula JLT2003]|uniref:Regulatory protein SenC n=1 Tax=Oceaniovalibus guishaninsula JLT2003 TaxID=1231392 RepID=K2HB56_9RHOB|nr:SCO family protein [Oceaniovalibus guishaninsula]EKE44693.1 regulatory protein SenC [Oceaniovalibus guishaninsula JLT2003]
MRRATLLVTVAAVAAAGLLAGTWYSTTRATDVFADCRSASVAGGTGAIGGPFTLVDQDGRTVTQDDVFTRPSLVYFGYTYCPDVCPLDAARNAEAVDLLTERGYDVQPVFITIDPERDTPEVLKAFAGYMHPDMIGLTGTPDQVRAASQAYKTYYSRRETDDPDNYLMDHSVFTYLVLPEHGFVDFFRGAPSYGGEGVEADEVAQRTACYLDAA